MPQAVSTLEQARQRVASKVELAHVSRGDASVTNAEYGYPDLAPWPDGTVPSWLASA